MSLEIRPVAGRKDLERFARFPWEIYRDDPHWVPPLRSDVIKLLTPGKHPFHEHAEVQPFLAWRENTVVGRIVATVNHAHNEFHHDEVGFFGFHDALRADDEASLRLFETAFSWLKERGRSHAMGPFELSTNEMCGLLVEGEPGPPVVMMPYNPPWYPERYEAAGLVKAKDLLAFIVHENDKLKRLSTLAEQLKKRNKVRIRPLDMKHFDREVDRVMALYNVCWEKNWGFVPMSADEIKHFAAEVRYAIDPELTLILEREESGEPVGFILALPDLNRALKHANGSLFPFGLLKILWHKRHIDGVRVVTLGLIPQMRGKGLDGVLIQAVVETGLKKGYHWAECSWVLEDNMPMIIPLQKFDAKPYRRYRIYQKAL